MVAVVRPGDGRGGLAMCARVMLALAAVPVRASGHEKAREARTFKGEGNGDGEETRAGGRTVAGSSVGPRSNDLVRTAMAGAGPGQAQADQGQGICSARPRAS